MHLLPGVAIARVAVVTGRAGEGFCVVLLCFVGVSGTAPAFAGTFDAVGACAAAGAQLLQHSQAGNAAAGGGGGLQASAYGRGREPAPPPNV
eukprot:678149-Pelagomonas_calceolata.AAC.1